MFPVVLIAVNATLLAARKLTIALLASVIMVALMVYFDFMAFSSSYIATYSGISVNPFSEFVSLVLTLFVALSAILAYSRHSSYIDYLLAFSVVLFGAWIVSFSTSPVTIFVGIEMMAASSVAAILLGKSHSLEAATKLFLAAIMAASIFAMGMAFAYGAFASLFSFTSLASPGLAQIAGLLLAVALFFEAAIFPFNTWIADAYQGAESFITAMLIGVNEKVGFTALMILIPLLLAAHTNGAFLYVAYAASVLTMFYGNIMAVVQTNAKRMLVFSSIAQAGYIAMGLAVATQYALEGMLLLMIAHALAIMGILGIVAFMETKGRAEINDYIGLIGENKLLAVCVIILLASLVGIPFTAGFIGKITLFSSAISSGMALLAFMGIANSVLSIYYYAKLATAVYTEKDNAIKFLVPSNIMLVVLFCTLAILAIGVFPARISSMVTEAVKYLMTSY